MTVSNVEGIKCPHCGKWNTHEECGTYQVLFPECISCGNCTEVPYQRSKNTMTTAAFEVVAGVLPGTPMKEYTKTFPYQAEDFEADKLVPQDEPTKYSKLSEEAHLYARELENPRNLNWVQVTWIWF